MSQLTSKELTVKLEQAASISVEVLKLSTAKELKEIAKGIVHGCSKMTKQQLIDEILKVTHSLRVKKESDEELKRLEEVAKVEDELYTKYEERIKAEITLQETKIPDNALLAVDYYGDKTEDEKHPVNIGIRLYRLIKSTVNTLMTSNEASLIPTKIAVIATKLATNERFHYPSITTRKNRRTDYLKSIEVSLHKDNDVAYRDTLTDTIKSFRTIMQDVFRDEVLTTNREYRERVTDSNKNREEINPINLLSGFIEVLKQPNRYKWTRLVVALAFVTGRRPSEILCSAQFEVIDSHHLVFKGQAKRRNNFNPEESLTIPTLVNTSLVMSCMEHLTTTNKRHPYNSEEHQSCLSLCDKKTSKELSREYDNTPEKFKSKDYRAMYGELSYLVFAPKECAQSVWFTQVLGHGEDQTATAASYVRYYISEEQIPVFKQMVLAN